MDLKKLVAEAEAEVNKEIWDSRKEYVKNWLKRPLWHRIFPFIITIKITRRKLDV